MVLLKSVSATGHVLYFTTFLKYVYSTHSFHLYPYQILIFPMMVGVAIIIQIIGWFIILCHSCCSESDVVIIQS